MSDNVIPLFPKPPPKPTQPRKKRKRQRYGLTKTATKWHLMSGASQHIARCGIRVRDAVELPPNLQPEDGDVCRACRGAVRRGCFW